ncbi:MAG TPA: S-layer homology domain-containing protein [Candidatus Aveggerthella excrementigallinarum]|nr:S-layer homology domain-containing protein [Candidatus Aveggerthella excrementigallinarum]
MGTTYEEFPLDLSERQLAWFARTPLPEDAGSQAGEGVHATNDDPNQRLNVGGFPFVATSVFSSGVGPISEEQAPYRNNEGLTVTGHDGYTEYSTGGDWSLDESLRFAQSYRLESSNILPSPLDSGIEFDENGIAQGTYKYNEQGTIAIKSELLEGRAVQIGFFADVSRPGQDTEPLFINTDTWAHYTYGSQYANHAVTIVGWDDDYSRENFLAGHQPPYDGAWIVKNSWGAGSQEFPNAGDWGIDEDGDGVGDGYFYLSYYDQSLMKPETLDFDVSGDEGRSSYIVNAYDYMPSQELNMVSSADPLQMANVFTAECDQLVTTVTTETSTPYTSVYYEVYMLDDNATNPTDGTLVASTSDTYQYGGFHQTDLQHGVVVREGQKFSVVVTQRTVTGQYQMQAECAIDKEGAEAIKEMSGTNMPTYTTGVVNESESYFSENGVWRDWLEGIAELESQAEPPITYDFDNFAIKAYADPLSLEFADVADDAWYADAVDYVTSNGIMFGYANSSTFGPNDTMMRQDVAVMLFRWLAPEEAAKYNDPDAADAVNNETGLADVADGAYYTPAVNWCYRNGILNGYSEGTNFGVGDPITREMVATVLHRSIGQGGGDAISGDFPDKADVSSWATSSMAWAVDTGIVHGSDGLLEPQRAITRAEMATMLLNAHNAGL